MTVSAPTPDLFAWVDALPLEWKRLVWEYNEPAVRALWGKVTPEEAKQRLETKRLRRQPGKAAL